MNFEIAEAAWWFGRLPSDRLPDLACAALEAGYDGPTLRQLAGLEAIPAPSAHKLMERALAEVGRRKLSKADAGRILARDYARQIVSGQLSPNAGARKLWQLDLDCEELSA